MRRNRYELARQEGRIPIGHMVTDFNVRGMPRILEQAGVDFMLIDMEHGAFGHSEVADLIAWCRGTCVAPFVRVPETSYSFIARVLDAGAIGIMVPNVRSSAQAGAIVQAAKYRPVGQRGLTFASAVNDFEDVPDVAQYMRDMNSRTVVICQIESSEGLEEIDGIAATPGVDILWIGQYDLTDSLGIVGQFENPRFVDAAQSCIAAAHRHGKLAAIQAGSVEQLRTWAPWGFDVLSFGEDLGVYVTAITGAIRELRETLKV